MAKIGASCDNSKTLITSLEGISIIFEVESVDFVILLESCNQ